MKPVRYHDEAAVELTEARDYYEARRLGLGADFIRHIEGAIENISHFPLIGAQYKELPVRRVVLTRFPYVLYYLDEPDAVWIIAVAHGRRRPEYWRHRLLN